MRIRSIRPEFWSSEDISCLAWEQRLIYIGLWSYVDDDGVGRDIERLVAADQLFDELVADNRIQRATCVYDAGWA